MAQEGIATLPQAPENQAVQPDINLIKQSIGQRIPGAEQAYDQTMDQISSQLNLPPDQLQQMLQILQYMLSHEQEYPQIRQRLISEGGVRPEDLPEQFDRGYLTTMLLMVQEALKRQGGGGAGPMAQAPQPQGFQKGGLAAAAQSLAAKGRGGDTILAHINPQEAMMLKAMGGSGTINPSTGIMEFKGGGGGGFNPVSWVSDGFKAVGNAVKEVASSTVGKVVMTVALGMVIGPAAIAALGPIGGAMAAGALASGAVSLAGGSNLKDSLRSAVIGGALAGIGAGVADFLPGTTGGWLNTGLTAGAVGTGYGLATGQNIGQALKTGAVAGLTAGAVAGAQGATMNGPAPTNNAPVFDNSTPYSGDVNVPTTPTTGEQANIITNQGGSITPTSEGISTLQTPDPYAVQDMQVQARSGEGILTANGQPAPVQGPAPYAGDQQYINQDMQPQARTGEGITRGTQASQPSTLEGYYNQGKNYLFGTDPANPGVFMNKEGGYSVPAITAGVLGIGALTGGFNASTPQSTSPGLVQRNPDGSPVTGENLVASNPSKYLVGNIPGYNAPQPTPAQANYVAAPAYGMNQRLPFATYTPPVNAISGQQGQPIQQPYNTAAMYNFMPRMYAEGGDVNPVAGIQSFKGGGAVRAIAQMEAENAAKAEAEKTAETPRFSYNMPFNADPDKYLVDNIPGVKRASIRTGSTTKLAQGGITQAYPRRTGGINGPGTGTSDSIPAMLSDGEFVITAKAVRGAGNGSRREGAKKLYRMMHALEKKAK
jgi:hypothetical protein